ncbi:MAG TPA: ornithine cyclodeaminase family protein [Flavilitoribacter sp.]|nr:ornithine cyclodeaminase family protein [Flavilitoribacter sp.]
MLQPLFITSGQINQNANYRELVEVLRAAFRSDITTPMRHHHDFPNPPNEKDSTLLLMPAWDAGKSLGVKIAGVFPDNGKLGLPAIQATYILLDGRTGELKAIMEGKNLTVTRTAAASALASDYLSRADSGSLFMIGAGALAPHLILAHAAVRPIGQVYVWGRNPASAARLCESLADQPFDIRPVEDIPTGMAMADIISCATLSPDPLVLGRYLKPGQHIDLVGSYKKNTREADDETILNAEIFVDTYQGALVETGDLAIPLATGVLERSAVKAELSELCSGQKPGRVSGSAITLFKSVGHASEDLAAANYFYSKIVRK